MKIIEIRDLMKNYRHVNALNKLNLDVSSGKILGILGPNGSGKTTLLKIIANLIKEDSGEILINKERPGINSRKLVSFMPDNDILMDWMDLNDAIGFYKDFFDDFNEEKTLEMLKILDLDKNLTTNVKKLSKGMREKFNLALTFGRDAMVYILDEPIGGVDIITRDKILESIISNFNQDSTIIITTHLIGEIEGIFDEVAFINQGRIILKEDADSLRESYGKDIEGVYREIYKEL